MSDKCLVVFTSRPVERMCAEGGSQAWTFSAINARTCTWLVCVWNAHGAYAEHAGGRPSHHEAFLIAPIDSVEPSPQEPNRWIVRFKQYAHLSIPHQWNGQRLPFRYTTLDDFGIQPEDLAWVSVAKSPQSNSQPLVVLEKPRALSVEEAKRGLATSFNVPPEAIEITIRV